MNKERVSLVLIVIYLAMLLLLNIDKCNGLAQNLVSETIGIMITVFIVDYLIDKDKTKRVLPSLQYFHSSLLQIISDSVKRLVPEQFRGTTFVYKHGQHTSICCSIITFSNILADALNRKFAEAANSNIELENKMAEAVATVSIMDRDLDKLFDKFVTIMDPKTMELLLQLQDDNKDIMGAIRAGDEFEDKYRATLFSGVLYSEITKIGRLQAHLVALADTKMSHEEYAAQVQGKLDLVKKMGL